MSQVSSPNACCLHHERGGGLHEAKSFPSRTQFSSVGAKPESGPHSTRSSPVAMGHAHASQLPQEQHDFLT